jgi:hypothetical protein
VDGVERGVFAFEHGGCTGRGGRLDEDGRRGSGDAEC